MVANTWDNFLSLWAACHLDTNLLIFPFYKIGPAFLYEKKNFIDIKLIVQLIYIIWEDFYLPEFKTDQPQ